MDGRHFGRHGDAGCREWAWAPIHWICVAEERNTDLVSHWEPEWDSRPGHANGAHCTMINFNMV